MSGEKIDPERLVYRNLPVNAANTAGAFNRLDYNNSPGSVTTSGEAAGWSDSCASSGNDLHAFGSPICDSSDGVCCGGDGGCTSDGPQWSPLVRSPDTPEYEPGKPDTDAPPQLKSANTAEETGWGAGSESESTLPPFPGLMTSSRNACLQHKTLTQLVGLVPSREDSPDGVCCGDDGGCTSDGPQWSQLLRSSDTPQYDSSKPGSKATPHHNAASVAEEAGWGADSESRDEEGEDRDEFLDDFARALDGSSCDDGNEEEEREERVRTAVDTAGDVMVARAMQEEEWRRSPPPPRTRHGIEGIEGCSSSSGSSSNKTNTTCGSMSSIYGSTSTFGATTTATSNSTYGSTNGGTPDSACGSRGSSGVASSPPSSYSLSSCSSLSAADAVSHALCPSVSRRRGAEAGSQSFVPGNPGNVGRPRAGGTGTAPSEMAKSGVGKRKKRVPSPPAWPPGGIKEGEGLPLVELPDEILEKVAAYGQMPRCVSKRIQRVRVKIARERVVAALESSAKLPADKAEDIEGAIFALVGGFVGKAYKAKARELAFNLRVGKNDPLRDAVLSGALLSWVLVRMSSDELAPLSVRLERERIAQKRIREVTSARDSPNHTVTERFTCPECGHERTQYRTWRRKAVVDRIRVIIQCLQCRHSWEL